MKSRFYASAGNPVKEILLKLNLPDHRSILTDSKEYIKMDMEVFDETPVKDVVSWNTILSVFLGMVWLKRGLGGYEQETTVVNALMSVYFGSWCFGEGRRVFVESGDRSVVTWTTMISGLAQNQFCEESLEVFVEMRKGLVSPNTLTYLSLLMACYGLKAVMKGCQIHGLVLKLSMNLDLHIESAFTDMYCKCGGMREA
ncbi:pentatricopeptide repeat-containing protein [Tanacetum coccineum]